MSAALTPSLCPFGLKRDDITYYTSHYCEENIWRLAQHMCEQQQQQQRAREYTAFVVFLSNDAQSVMLAGQRSATGGVAVCVWDYHVVLVLATTPTDDGAAMTEALVYDFDSEMPFPSTLHAYLAHTFRWPPAKHNAHLQPLFRVVDAAAFLLNFASDRSHMITPNSSPPAFTVTPPTLAPIRTKHCSMNLDEYRIIRTGMLVSDHTVATSNVFGRVMTMTQLLANFVRQQR